MLADGMPNGTLCGRAVAKMVLSQLGSSSPESAQAALDDVASSLIEAGDLPEQYLLTPERIERTMKMPTVGMREEAAGRPLAGDKMKDDGSDGFVTDEDDAEEKNVKSTSPDRCILM